MKIELTDNEVQTLKDLIYNIFHSITVRIEDKYYCQYVDKLNTDTLSDLVYIAQELYDGNYVDMVKGLCTEKQFEEFKRLLRQ